MKKYLLPLALAITSVTHAAEPFSLSSPDFKEGGTIANEHVFNGFGCTGGNLSPALLWSGAPAGTKSLAVLVHDAAAPTGGAGWWHWAVINIPATATALAKGAGEVSGSKLPAGSRQITTDFGAPGWGGPCPPQGNAPHPYVFTLHALKVEKLELPPNATASLAGYMVNANTLAKTTLTGRYGRPPAQ